MAVITPLLLVLGCGSETPDPAPSPVGDVETTPETVTEAVPEALSATRLLIRASLDLRGVRPSIVELEAVEADPSQLDGLIADFLYDERFADQIVALYAEIYQTQSDIPRVGYGDKTSDYPRMVASMGQEPLRILAHIADHDLPYTEISTADWTMANEYIAEVWPVDGGRDRLAAGRVHR